MNLDIAYFHSLFLCLLFPKASNKTRQSSQEGQGIAAKVVPATIPCRSRRMADSRKPGRPFAFGGNSIREPKKRGLATPLLPPALA